MNWVVIFLCLISVNEVLSFSEIKSDSVICEECSKVKRIDFYYLGWNFNPATVRDEESVRSNREEQTKFFSINDRDSINAVLFEYFDCQNRNYETKPEKAVIMIIELIMENNDVHKILVSPYYSFHDHYGSSYRNLKAIRNILNHVPNTNSRLEKWEGSWR